jgi:hypothetical protein
MTRAQWMRYLIFNKPLDIKQRPRLFPEFILHVCNEKENESLQFFRIAAGPACNDELSEALLMATADEDAQDHTEEKAHKSSLIPSFQVVRFTI